MSHAPRSARPLVYAVLFVLGGALSAVAGNPGSDADFLVARAARDPWKLDWISIGAPPVRHAAALAVRPVVFAYTQDAQPLHAAAIEHSSAYETRAKIHKYASVATLPLFAGEYFLGQSMYNSSTRPGGKRGLHAALGGGLIGLFAVNTVTGSWNLFGEGWQEKQGRTLRLVHGLLMMAADAGFVDTWATGPHSGRLRTALTYEQDKRLHRNVAVASIGVGTAGYLIMFLANHL